MDAYPKNENDSGRQAMLRTIHKLEAQLRNARKILFKEIIHADNGGIIGTQWLECTDADTLKAYIKKLLLKIRIMEKSLVHGGDGDATTEIGQSVHTMGKLVEVMATEVQSGDELSGRDRERLLESRNMIDMLLGKEFTNEGTQTYELNKEDEAEEDSSSSNTIVESKKKKKIKGGNGSWITKLNRYIKKGTAGLFDFARKAEPSSIPPVSRGGLMKMILHIFNEKMEVDMQHDENNMKRRTLNDFLCDVFLNKFGLLSIAQRNLAQFLISIKVKAASIDPNSLSTLHLVDGKGARVR